MGVIPIFAPLLAEKTPREEMSHPSQTNWTNFYPRRSPSKINFDEDFRRQQMENGLATLLCSKMRGFSNNLQNNMIDIYISEQALALVTP